MRCFFHLIFLFVITTQLYTFDEVKPLNFLGLKLDMTKQEILSELKQQGIDISDKNWGNGTGVKAKVLGIDCKLDFYFKNNELVDFNLNTKLDKPIKFKDLSLYKGLVKSNGKPNEIRGDLRRWIRDRSNLKCQQMRIWPKDRDQPYFRLHIKMNSTEK